MKAYELKLQQHSFLISAVGGRGGLGSCHGCFTIEEKLLVSIE